MSPRGVYNRKGKKAEKIASKTMGRTVQASAQITALPTPNNVGERFAILRDNITTLTHVRATLSAADDVAKRTETEIIQHIVALTDLRKQIFGQSSEEAEVERSKVYANGNGHLHTATPVAVGPTPSA